MTTTLLAHGIQLAVAPVFLLTAVATLIGIVGVRLARIIDRARILEERLDANTVADRDAAHREIGLLTRRGHLVNWAVALLTIAAMLISITIVALFLSEISTLHTSLVIPASFLAGLLCFILALLCFLVETRLSTHVLEVGRKRSP